VSDYDTARTQLTDSDNIRVPDEKQNVVQLNRVSQTLRLFSAPVEAELDLDFELLLSKHAFSFIVRCLQTYLRYSYLRHVCRPRLMGIMIIFETCQS